MAKCERYFELIRSFLVRIAFACTAFAFGVVHPRPARAATADEAEALISRGIELRERGEDDEALALFKAAQAQASSPRGRAQVALAEHALGLWLVAESDLAAALAAERDPWIEKNRAALEGALIIVRRHLGSLDVHGTSGAEVVLDGVSLGMIPATAPFRVEAGTRTLEVRATGFYATKRAVEVPSGGVSRETVMLVPLPATSPHDGASRGERHQARVGGANDGAYLGDPGRSQRMSGWALTSVGSALVLTGGIGLLVRQRIVDDYNSSCPGLGALQSVDCENRVESARTWLTVSLVSFVSGGVFALGGLALAATAPRTQPSVATGGVQCAPVLDRRGGNLHCVGSF